MNSVREPLLRCRRLQWVAAVLALLVFASGATRLFVLCLGHHAEPRLEVVHGGCCEHGADAAAAAGEAGHADGEAVHGDADCERCFDRQSLPPTSPPRAGERLAESFAAAPPLALAPPATGPPPPAVRCGVPLRPPRQGQLLRLRRSVVLLI